MFFMTIFRPQTLPVIGLIVPFVLLFAALFSLWDLMMALWARYVSRESPANLHRYLGFVLCAGCVLLLVLQSLGQLTVRDVVTLVAVMILSYLYLVRNRFTLPKH